MKKDKEWLKERVASELEFWDGSESGWSEDVIITIIDLIDQLEEPENPVIPQYVTDWLEYRRKDFHSGYEAVSYIYNFGWDDETRVEFDIYNWIKDKDKERLFIEAFEDGYDVEKEPQWVVKDDTGYLSYLQFSIPNIYERETSLNKNDAYKFKSKLKADLFADLLTGTVEEVTD